MVMLHNFVIEIIILFIIHSYKDVNISFIRVTNILDHKLYSFYPCLCWDISKNKLHFLIPYY